MNEPKNTPKTASVDDKSLSREERLAQALRANLRRRKAPRASPDTDEPDAQANAQEPDATAKTASKLPEDPS